MSERKKLVAGNWKMNGSLAANQALVQALRQGVGQPACDVAVCPPSVYLGQLQQLLAGQTAIALGAQDLSQHEGGAFTGDVSATMLKDFGVRYAIVGHSERRQHQGETDLQVALKVRRALAAGITPFVCVGETLREREEGLTEFIVKRQLSAVLHLNGHAINETVVAYEPVWAIGTGKTCASDEANRVCGFIRDVLAKTVEPEVVEHIRVLYGGSVKGANSYELFSQPFIDGGLVGGASLDPGEFSRIVSNA